MYMTGLNLVAA